MNEEMILDKMLECDTACAPLGTFDTTHAKDGLAKIDWLVEVLPGIEYVLGQVLNYIFSNGLTTGLVKEDEILEAWLYRNNLQNVTNYAVLRDIIATATIYGEGGARWYKDNLYFTPVGSFCPVTATEDGIKRVVAFAVTKDGSRKTEDEFKIRLSNAFSVENEGLDTYGMLEERIAEQGLILLDASDFLHIRNDTRYLHGSSPLLKDALRMELLVTAYERLNYDLKYDGTGRIVLHPKDGYVSGGDNEISSSEVVNKSAPVQKDRDSKMRKEVEKVAAQIKASGSDSVIFLSEYFDNDITKLPRVTKATEFFGWLENEGVILAQTLGMSPSLLELGRLSGNVSMEKIIDNSMVNNIIPLRERYAIQFSEFLSKKIGVRKVFFDKYEMQQAENENTERTKIVNIMSLLNSMKDNEDVTRGIALKLFNDFGEMLENNIHNDAGDLVALAIGRKNNEQEDTGNSESGGSRRTVRGSERGKSSIV